MRILKFWSPSLIKMKSSLPIFVSPFLLAVFTSGSYECMSYSWPENVMIGCTTIEILDYVLCKESRIMIE